MIFFLKKKDLDDVELNVYDYSKTPQDATEFSMVKFKYKVL